MSKSERIGIRLEPEFVKALDEMARQSGLTRAALAASVVREVLRDDAQAHGREIERV